MAGQLVHFELPVKDLDRAQEFFGGLFAWSYEPFGPEYRFVNGTPSGGLYPAGEVDRTVVYFGVEDLEAATARVAELGGSAESITPIPGVGRFSHCKDDQGTAFSLFQPGEAS
jgi:hypothetical protein